MMYSHKTYRRNLPLPGLLGLANLHESGVDADLERLTSTTDSTPHTKSARVLWKQICRECQRTSDIIAHWSTRIDGLPRP